jgi:molybdopterin converting factor small subunit
MPVIWIPALLRDLAGGQEQVKVPGATLRQALDELTALYPELRARLVEGDQLRPGFSVMVDGTASYLKLRQPLSENSEVHLLPAISGG